MRKLITNVLAVAVVLAVSATYVYATITNYDDLAVRGGVILGANSGTPAANTLEFAGSTNCIHFSNGCSIEATSSGQTAHANDMVLLFRGTSEEAQDMLYLDSTGVLLKSLNYDVDLNNYYSNSIGVGLTVKNSGGIQIRFK